MASHLRCTSSPLALPSRPACYPAPSHTHTAVAFASSDPGRSQRHNLHRHVLLSRSRHGVYPSRLPYVGDEDVCERGWAAHRVTTAVQAPKLRQRIVVVWGEAAVSPCEVARGATAGYPAYRAGRRDYHHAAARRRARYTLCTCDRHALWDAPCRWAPHFEATRPQPNDGQLLGLRIQPSPRLLLSQDV